MSRTTRRWIGVALPCALVLLAAAPAHAGWTLASNGTGQDAGFFAVSAADDQTAMAVGTHKDPSSGNATGVIAMTSDGGVSWHTDSPNGGVPAMMPMYLCIDMVSPQVAFAGSPGKMLSTVDGGSTWTAYTESGWSFLNGPQIKGVSFGNDSTGFFVGTGGLVRKTTDQGVTWTPLDSPVAGADLGGVRALDASHVWIWGGAPVKDASTGEVTGYGGGLLARSTDGGANWSVVFQDEERMVQRVFMLNASEGWMLSVSMSGPRLEHTTNGGATWTDMAMPSGSEGAPDNGWDVAFLDRCEGFLLVERAQNTMLFYTTDRGASWSQVDLTSLRVSLPFPFPVYPRLTALAFPSRTFGFGVGFYEALCGYMADGAGPNCGGSSDGGGGGSGGDDGGCGCRAAGAGGGAAGIVLLVGLALVLRRRSTRATPVRRG